MGLRVTLEAPSVSVAPAVSARLPLLAAALALFATSQDSNMVIVALPALGRALGLDPAAAVWLLLAGLLTTVALLLPAGRWADHSDSRAGFLVGTAGFGLASLLAGLAPSLQILFAARALEGAFGALLLVLVMSVAIDAMGEEGRGKAVGLMSAVLPLGAITGPQLAALALSSAGWRPVFLAAAPISALAFAIGWVSIPAGGEILPPRPRWLLEGAALALAAGGIFAVLRLAGGGSPTWYWLAAAGATSVAGFWIWARLPQARGVYRLVAARRMWLPLAGLAGMATSMGVIGYLVPFLMTGRLHQGVAMTGMTFMALSLGQAAASLGGGFLIDRLGGWSMALAGAILMVSGVALLVPLESGWSAVDVGWRVGIIGLGVGLVIGANQSTVMGLAPSHHSATANAVSSMLRNLFYGLGAGVTAIILTVVGGDAGLNAGIRLAAAVALVSVVAAFLMRGVMKSLDEPSHHHLAHAAHHPLHSVEGLAREHR